MCKSMRTLAWLVHAKTIKWKMWTSSSCRRFEILPVNCGSRHFTTVSKGLLSIIKEKEGGANESYGLRQQQKSLISNSVRASNIYKASDRLSMVKVEHISEGCVSAEFRRGITVGQLGGLSLNKRPPNVSAITATCNKRATALGSNGERGARNPRVPLGVPHGPQFEWWRRDMME